MWNFNFIAGLLIVAGLLAIIAAGMRRRALEDRKLRELLPDKNSIVRVPPFYNVLPQSVPDTENGRRFLAYRKTLLRETWIVIGASIVVMVISRLAISMN